ncbi:DUF2225 domain-containing protein [Bacillus sp. CGMCC 1.16541]|uniref:DUF2225 domain-containing protein n=1 Tax=Bacillus sp. CGMCC 1.16541 TaxID=2185143 RepID=UPI000D73636A|nr:DUF2225 domain-containing protein [Bacillus sp. CGMCC 1.16541]
MEHLTPLYDKKVTCSLCTSTYTTKKVRSRFIKVVNIDTDFFTHYADEQLNPLLYHIHVCPMCGYSSTEDFSPSFPLNTAQMMKEKVHEQWVHQDYGQERTIEDAIKTYKLALFCALIKKEKHITTAGLLLRLSWLYRMNNEHQIEMHFLEHALNYYEASYSTDDFIHSKMSIVKVLYLIGELSMCQGNKQKAALYFSEIIQKYSKHEDQQTVSMTRDRWYEIREQNKKRA